MNRYISSKKKSINSSITISKQFNNITIDFIEQDEDYWLTAKTIGNALGYRSPRKSIMNLYHAHKDEIEEYASLLELSTPGGPQETTIFSERGIYLLLMFSKQPIAKRFRKWLVSFLRCLKNRSKEELFLKIRNPSKKETKKVHSNLWIYFIQEKGSGNIKIGVSKSPAKRLKQLQVYNSTSLKLIFTIKGSYEIEGEIHDKFSKYNIHGEWFQGEEEILNYINNLKENKLVSLQKKK